MCVQETRWRNSRAQSKEEDTKKVGRSDPEGRACEQVEIKGDGGCSRWIRFTISWDLTRRRVS